MSSVSLSESTVMQVCDDLLSAADSNQVSAICILDLTATSDVDYNLLLFRLQRQFGHHGLMVHVTYHIFLISGNISIALI